MINRCSDWHRSTMIFLCSQGITLFGSQIVQMAIVWYVTICTSSGAWVAAFSLSSYLPQFLVSFLGGELADRYQKKHLIIYADSLIAAVTFVMVLWIPYIRGDRTVLTALCVMSIIRSAGAGIQVPAVNAMTAQLVPSGEYVKYNAIHATIQSVVQFAAPAVAMIFLTVWSLRATLVIDVLTAVFGIGMLHKLEVKEKLNIHVKYGPALEVKEWIRYAYSCDVVRYVLVIYGLFLFWSVPAGYLSGLYVSREYGADYWYLTSVELAGFGGMALGGVLMTKWPEREQTNYTLIIGLSVFGLMSIAMAVSRRFSVYLLWMTIYGVAMTMIQVTITTHLQRSAEPEMHGRIFGLMSSLYASCYPVGMAVFGVMADRMSLKWIMIVSGVALDMMAAYDLVKCKQMSAGE